MLGANWQDDHEPAMCPWGTVKANSFLGHIRRNIASKLRMVILAFRSALVRPPLERWVLCWAPQYKRVMDVLETDQ